MTLTSEEVDKVLSRLADKAMALPKTHRPVGRWLALDVLAHVEADLFGRDPGCQGRCPLCA